MRKCFELYLSFVVVALLILTSCGSVKKVKWNTEDLVIKSAYVQEQIPGIEDAEILKYLFIELKNLDPLIKVDSVQYMSSMVKVWNSRNFLKVNLNKGVNIDGDPLDADKAVIYYTNAEKAYKTLVENVVEKEAIYLP